MKVRKSPVFSEKFYNPVGVGIIKKRHSIFYLLLVLFIILAFEIKGQSIINDEIDYILMADSIDKTHSMGIINGVDEINTQEFKLYATNVLEKDGVRRLYSIYPPLYPYLAYPFYHLSGIDGLVLMGILSFLGSTYLVHFICMRVFNRLDVAFLSAVVFSVLTYSIKYSVELIPHSLTVFLTLLPVALVLNYQDNKMAFIAGLISSTASGVRYQCLLLTLVLVVFVYCRRRAINAIFFVLGAAIPLILIGWINHGLYGWPLQTGYTGELGNPLSSYRATNLVVGTLFFIAYLRRRWISDNVTKGGAGSWLISAASLLILGFFILRSDYLLVPLRVIYSHLVDFSMNVEYASLPHKRAVLQSSPVLILAVLGAILMKRKKIDPYVLQLMIALPAIEILFIGGFEGESGRLDLMRYLSEAVPYLSIFAGYALVMLFLDTRWMSNPITVAFYMLITFLVAELINTAGPIWLTYYTLKLPVFLAFLVLFAGWGRTKPDKLLSYCILSVILYSLMFNIFAVYMSYSTRDHIQSVREELGQYIVDNSVVVHSNNLMQTIFAPLKTEKKIRLAYLDDGDKLTNDALMNYYLEKNVPVYLMQSKNGSLNLAANRVLTEYGTAYLGSAGNDISMSDGGAISLFRITSAKNNSIT